MKTFCGVCIVLRQSISRFSTSYMDLSLKFTRLRPPFPGPCFFLPPPFSQPPCILWRHISDPTPVLLWCIALSINLKGQLAKELFGIDMWELSYNEGIPAWLPLTTMLLYLFKLGARNRTFGPLPHAKELHNIFRAEKIICSWVFTLHDGF